MQCETADVEFRLPQNGAAPCHHCGGAKVEDVRRRVMSQFVSAAFWVCGAPIGRVINGGTDHDVAASETIRVLVRGE